MDTEITTVWSCFFFLFCHFLPTCKLSKAQVWVSVLSKCFWRTKCYSNNEEHLPLSVLIYWKAHQRAEFPATDCWIWYDTAPGIIVGREIRQKWRKFNHHHQHQNHLPATKWRHRFLSASQTSHHSYLTSHKHIPFSWIFLFPTFIYSVTCVALVVLGLRMTLHLLLTLLALHNERPLSFASPEQFRVVPGQSTTSVAIVPYGQIK